jgi:hypothetical protein
MGKERPMTRVLLKVGLGAIVALGLAGCVYEPAPYYAPAPYYYAPAPAYYAPPAYYYGGPTVALGFGFRGGYRHWR